MSYPGSKIYQSPLFLPERRLAISVSAGNSMSIQTIRKARQIVSSIPILAIPLCGERDRLLVLIMRVRVLSNTARAVLVLSILPSGGGSVR